MSRPVTLNPNRKFLAILAIGGLATAGSLGTNQALEGHCPLNTESGAVIQPIDLPPTPQPAVDESLTLDELFKSRLFLER